MTVANGQLEALGYIAEVTWGTTPGTPNLQLVRHTGITSSIEKQTTESAEVSTARATADIIQTSKRGGFGINFELSYAAQFEAWLEGLLGGAWATNVLKVASTKKSFTFERRWADAGQYMVYTGAMPARMSFNVARGSIINGAVEFRSKFPTLSGSVIAGSTTTAVGTNPVMDPISSVQLIQEGGAGAVAGPTECSINIENGLIDLDQLASTDPLDIFLGELRASGRLSLYFQDATYWTKFAGHTTTSLKVTLGGVTNLKYELLFNKIKLTAADVPNQGKGTAIIQTYDWQAFTDSVESIVRVTRTP